MEKEKTEIKRMVARYILGCFLIVAASLAMASLGVLVILGYDLPEGFLIFILVPFCLLFDIIRALGRKVKLPDDFAEIHSSDYPALFKLLDEVQEELHVQSFDHVYICDDATAAIFSMPRIPNLFSNKPRNLVLGLALLSQMDDEEIKAILYHEYGHYLGNDLDSTEYVYRVGQFAKFFTSVNREPLHKTIDLVIQSFVGLFSYYTLYRCGKIADHYKKLSPFLEMHADKFACDRVGANNLQRALIHACCLDFQYSFLKWAAVLLRKQNIGMADRYEALSLIYANTHPKADSIRQSILKRIEVLEPVTCEYGRHSMTVKESLPKSLVPKCDESLTKMSSKDLLPWFVDGIAEYEYQNILKKSVKLVIHIGHRKHKLPYAEGIYQVVLDGKAIGRGYFIREFSLVKRISPSKHVLSFHAPAGIISDHFEFEADAGDVCRIELDYSYHPKESSYKVFVESLEKNQRACKI